MLLSLNLFLHIARYFMCCLTVSTDSVIFWLILMVRIIIVIIIEMVIGQHASLMVFFVRA